MRGILKYPLNTVISDWTIVSYTAEKRYVLNCKCGNSAKGKSDFVKSKENQLQTVGYSGCMQCAHARRRELQSETQQHRYAYRKYVLGAKRRNIPFNLSEEQTLELFKSPCHYCGGAPGSKVPRAKGPDKKYLYHQGIDRIDSSLGYTPSNVVPCCKVCNTAKLDLAYDEFLQHIEKIYLRNVQRLDRKIVEPSGSKWGAPLN